MKRRKVMMLLVTAILGLGFISSEAAEKKTKPKKQTNCPVMQRTPIDNTLYVDVKGKRVYTCCSGCIAQVKGNPDKYIKRLEDKGVVLEKAPIKVQTVCPVMGGKINKSQYADVNGKRIYVCCPGCIDTIKGDPEKYIKKLEAEGVTIEKAADKTTESLEYQEQ